MPRQMDGDIVTMDEPPDPYSSALGSALGTDPYAEHASRMSGAQVPVPPPAPPYPLYGVGQAVEQPFWKRPIVTFVFGASAVGLAWAYVAYIRPKMLAAKKKGRKK